MDIYGFHILTIVNSAIMNTEVQKFPWDPISVILDEYPKVGLLVLTFWGNFILFPIAAALFYSPTNSVQRFQFLYILTNTVDFYFFDDSQCEMIYHDGLNLHFHND